ncbi:hypothetical protein FBU30_002209 [Linnemannia zychae]|nr:hypothetical protein FBU30_002209 [Linnemannia zychae]
MLATHLKQPSGASTSNASSINNHNYNSFAQGYNINTSNNSSNVNTQEDNNPQSVSARLSAGMIPYFIPPPPPSNTAHSSRGGGTVGHQRSYSADNADSVLDPTLMTPPMSPTNHSFDFAATINSRFDAATTLSSSSSSSSSSSTPTHQEYQKLHHQVLQPWVFSYEGQPHPPRIDRDSASLFGTSSPASTGFSSISPRPVSFHWEDYESLEDNMDDSSDEDEFGYLDHHSIHRRQEQYRANNDSDHEHRGKGIDSDHEEEIRRAYQSQFEGHHSTVRRRSSFSGHSGGSSGHGLDPFSEDGIYDSLRHGIGQNISDVSEELAKTRLAMNRASQAMRNMEQELKAMQLSIDESKASNASTRSAIEENFWRLECLALTLEKDRQDMQKQLQAAGKDCHQAFETVTNWEVRIDWLERRVDNTSGYVSELVLSEQECMSFIKMIIQQNKRYAMPAISRATERNIKLMAPPKPKEITASLMPPGSPSPSLPQPIHPSPAPPPQSPAYTSARVGHIPISWLLDPLLPARPPDISSVQDSELHEQSRSSSNSTANHHVEPPVEIWRDLSRLTRAFETGQARTPFSPFQRTRTRSASQSQGFTPAHSFLQSNNNGNGNSLFKQAMTRRPQVEALSPMPKILPPAVPSANKMANIKRRSHNLPHFPVHSWLQFQFNKTMTTPGPISSGGKKKTNVLGFQPITIFQTTADNLPFVPRRNKNKR